MTDLKLPAGAALVAIPGVDVLATGTWNLSSGPATFTTEDLAAAVEAAGCPSVGPPVLKLGHIDPRFDGEPAVGRVSNMALTASGNKITGDLTGLPAWLGSPDENGQTVLASAYPSRSVEGSWGFVCQQGHAHPFVITALALLGVARPGVGVLSSLSDIAALFGVAAAAPGVTWNLDLGGGPMDGLVMAAGITTEDVRRAYYGSGVGYAMWITEMQLSPPQLIVADESTSQVFRVPVTIKGTTVTFGDPVEVEVTYVDAAPAAASSPARVAFASAAESRQGTVMAWDGGAAQKNLGTDPSPAQLKALYAIPGDTKSDSKLPHHAVSADGTVGAADDTACSSAIGVLNGGMGGLKDCTDAEKQAAYSHLAAHLRADGKDVPDFTGTAGEPAPLVIDAAGAHGAFTGSHSHPHSPMGSQGGDATHDHSHSHDGSGSHVHEHAPTAGSPTEGAEMDFSDEQMATLRTRLGLASDAELTGDQILAALAETPVSAGSGRLPSGVVAIDKDVWEETQKRIKRGEEARASQLRNERDTAIATAVQAGKFPVHRVPHWERIWDADPDSTREVLAGLTPGQVPTKDIGDPGSDMAELDDEFSGLFPPEQPIRRPA